MFCIQITSITYFEQVPKFLTKVTSNCITVFSNTKLQCSAATAAKVHQLRVATLKRFHDSKLMKLEM
jgi:hypothetical protein